MARREVKIFCPKCEWEPEQSSRWMCECMEYWNTFDTGGVCPNCGKVWTETQCLACIRWSAHADWYHEFTYDETTTREEVTHTARISKTTVESIRHQITGGSSILSARPGPTMMRSGNNNPPR